MFGNLMMLSLGYKLSTRLGRMCNWC